MSAGCPACAGHDNRCHRPRRRAIQKSKTWMGGTSPAMTKKGTKMKGSGKRKRQKAGDKRPGNAPAPESPAPSPLDYAQSVMRDEGKPDALRLSAAKLAASLTPKSEAQEGAAQAPDEEAEQTR